MKCPHCETAIEGVIPRERLNGKNQQIKELQAQLEAASEAAQAAGKLEAQATELQAQLAAAQAEHQAYVLQSETSADLMRAGVLDAEDQDLVRWRYERLGEDRPSFADWLQAGAREDRHLASLWAAPAAPAEAPAAPATQAAPPAAPAPVAALPPAPPSNAGARLQAVAPPPSYSPADVATMPLEQLREALRSGAFK